MALRLDHLRRLTLDAIVRGRRVRVVSVYAEAPDYDPVASPARDGSEGVACVDDAARAAVVWLRELEARGDPAALREARGLLDFVVAMEQGDGEWVNFIGPDGQPDPRPPSSRKSFSYWGARALWALGEGVRVLGPRDPAAAAPLRAPLDRALARLRETVDGGRLVGGSATATAEALLGLWALQRAEPTAERAALLGRTADLLARLPGGGRDRPPWGAFVDAPGATWHAWGARTTEALARAGALLGRPDLVASARREADGLWVRLLLSGDRAAEIAAGGDVRPFPQIAYGVSPMVGGFLALADATGDRRYAILAGLAGGWLLGGNRAGLPMYDEATGRTFDGLNGPTAAALNPNAGAESTVEALLALGAAAADPDAAAHLRDRPQGPPARLAAPPEERRFSGPGGPGPVLLLARVEGGFRLEELPRPGGPIDLTYWPAANPMEVAIAQKLAAAWNGAHPEVKVRVQPIPAGRSSEEVLLAAIVARATPDLCSNISSPLLARLVRAGGVVRLDTLAPLAARLRERTREAMLEPLRLPDGGLYALPWKVNPLMLMVNLDLLGAAGLAPPRTYGALLAAARALVRDTDGDGRPDRWALWMPLKTTWFERFYDFYPLYLAASGGKTLLDHGQVAFESPAAVGVLELLRTGFAEHLFPRSNFEGRDPFIDGIVAMKLIGPWFVHDIEEMKPDLRYDVVPVPRPDGADPAAAQSFADLKSIAIFSTTRHPAEAARFLAFLTSPEADRLLVTDGYQLPYRRDLAQDPRFRQALARRPVFLAYAREVERARDLDVDPDVVEILDLISEAYEAAAIYGTIPPARALHQAAVEAKSLLHAR